MEGVGCTCENGIGYSGVNSTHPSPINPPGSLIKAGGVDFFGVSLSNVGNLIAINAPRHPKRKTDLCGCTGVLKIEIQVRLKEPPATDQGSYTLFWVFG